MVTNLSYCVGARELRVRQPDGEPALLRELVQQDDHRAPRHQDGRHAGREQCQSKGQYRDINMTTTPPLSLELFGSLYNFFIFLFSN